MKVRAVYIIVPLVCIVLVVFVLGTPWIIEVPILLFVGWAIYLYHIVPMVRLNVPAIGVFVVALPLATWMLHRFLVWLWTGFGHATPWRWKWSIAGIAGVMLMFVIGVAATGIVHQTGWLITSSQPLVASNWSGIYRVKCASNLRFISMALREYADRHPGYQPTSMAEVVDIVLAFESSVDCFVCPASNHDRAPGTQPADWRAALLESDAYNSYALAAPGTLAPDGRPVLLYDRSINHHDNGINLLHPEGDATYLASPTAESWLAARR